MSIHTNLHSYSPSVSMREFRADLRFAAEFAAGFSKQRRTSRRHPSSARSPLPTAIPERLTLRTSPDQGDAAAQELPSAPLDPRQNPDDPELKKLVDDLEAALNAAKNRLLWKECFPVEAVLPGLEQTYDTAINAIHGKLHNQMAVPPQKMTPAGWRGWVLVVARNNTISILRRKLKTVALPDDDLLPRSPDTTDVRDRSLALGAFRQLPHSARNLIAPVCFRGMTKARAAKRFNMSEATFHRAFNKAIRLLRAVFDRLEREFWE